MVKIFYKYINKFIDENVLIEELETFCNNLSNENDKSSIRKLINDINELNNDMQNEFLSIKYDKIFDSLINNDVYLRIVSEMSDNDLMLLITEYLSVPRVFNLNQDKFDNLVLAAINSGIGSKENCFRLVTNYESHNLNFDKVIDYYISIRDVWYIIELMHFLQDDYDLESIVDRIIETKDKDFVKEILDDEFINYTLSSYLIEKLKEQL